MYYDSTISARDMYLTEEERAKSLEIVENYMLYSGEYGRVLKIFENQRDKNQSLEVVMNISGAISRIFADLVFLHPVDIGHSDAKVEEVIDEIAYRSNFDVMLWESAIAQSYAGFAVFKARKLNDGKVVIEEVQPSIVFPRFNRRNINSTPEEVIISYEVELEGDKSKYAYFERHTAGLIEYKLMEIDKHGQMIAQAPIALFDQSLPNSEQTGLDYIPIWIVRNPKTGAEKFGVSDYRDMRSMLTELTRCMSQIATGLRNTGNALLVVPTGVLDERGRVHRDQLGMIEIDANEGDTVIPQYITNSNPQTDMAFQQIESLVLSIARVTEVSSILIDMNVSGGVEKVGALRLRLMRTLAKVRRKSKFYEKALKDMLAKTYEWETGKKLDPREITLTFHNGLPEDMLQMIQEESLRITAGLQSRKDALRRLDGIDGEMLEQKLEEIADDSRADFTQTPAFNL